MKQTQIFIFDCKDFLKLTTFYYLLLFSIIFRFDIIVCHKHFFDYFKIILSYYILFRCFKIVRLLRENAIQAAHDFAAGRFIGPQGKIHQTVQSFEKIL